MAYLVDSDILIDFLGDAEEAVATLASMADEGIAVSVITYLEVYEGMASQPAAQESVRDLEEFVNEVLLLTITPAIARRCALLRRELRTQGKRVNSRAFDLLIAATALEHDLVLMTRNTHDYEDIPGLRLY